MKKMKNAKGYYRQDFTFDGKIEKEVLVAIAVYIGKTRLIDNLIFGE